MTSEVAAAPPKAPPSRLITPARGWAFVELAALWRYRQLVWLLASRDMRLRYRQALLGVTWVVLQPLATAAMFALLFGALIDPERLPGPPGIPYWVSTYCGLILWQLFARSLTAAGNSLVANQHLITRIYFPRIILPVASILAVVADFAVTLALLAGILGWRGQLPGVALLAALPIVALTCLAALALALWLSALNALYRDAQYLTGYLLQLWMLASPVLYTSEALLAAYPRWRWLYALNPMAGLVEGFRWSLLAGEGPPPPWAAGLALLAALALAGGFFFKRMERRFVDLL